MVSLRIQRVKNETELEDKISDYLAMGYKIKRRQDNSAELWKRNYGGILLHIILFILSGFTGILNILYLLYKHFSPEDAVLIKIDNKSNS
ncbi:conserved hypothetical protein [Methanocaldococcus vulcanius M7]|uniref:DUF8108 domain-containing protein n=1 Tax=Methanocaldococcus vulcanius (strain ATCC 700851 / DSM 12094 / M7) TaxID=579137 RepID=C9RI30_METVM|nr:hypothetical protein [Methanocaldococcus vulcanius]ACX73232.1 conserved hypothetical protein [Methanocaldococcus vulcanius M7]